MLSNKLPMQKTMTALISLLTNLPWTLPLDGGCGQRSQAVYSVAAKYNGSSSWLIRRFHIDNTPVAKYNTSQNIGVAVDLY